MKRRSQKDPPRDREMEKVHAMTHVKLTRDEVRERLLADKAACEQRLKELFELRRTIGRQAFDRNEQARSAITAASAELRHIKAQL